MKQLILTMSLVGIISNLYSQEFLAFNDNGQNSIELQAENEIWKLISPFHIDTVIMAEVNSSILKQCSCTLEQYCTADDGSTKADILTFNSGIECSKDSHCIKACQNYAAKITTDRCKYLASFTSGVCK